MQLQKSAWKIFVPCETAEVINQNYYIFLISPIKMKLNDWNDNLLNFVV